MAVKSSRRPDQPRVHWSAQFKRLRNRGKWAAALAKLRLPWAKVLTHTTLQYIPTQQYAQQSKQCDHLLPGYGVGPTAEGPPAPEEHTKSAVTIVAISPSGQVPNAHSRHAYYTSYPVLQRSEQQIWPNEPMVRLKVRLFETPPNQEWRVPPPSAITAMFAGAVCENQQTFEKVGIVEGALFELQWEPPLQIYYEHYVHREQTIGASRLDVWQHERLADCLLRTLRTKPTGHTWLLRRQGSKPRRTELNSTVEANGFKSEDRLICRSEPVGWLRADPSARSVHENTTIENITVFNDTAQAYDVFWVDGAGKLKKYGGVKPGRNWEGCAHTYTTHPWLLWPQGLPPPKDAQSDDRASEVFEFTQSNTTINASEVAERC